MFTSCQRVVGVKDDLTVDLTNFACLDTLVGNLLGHGLQHRRVVDVSHDDVVLLTQVVAVVWVTAKAVMYRYQFEGFGR